jgi:hypothetical protein
LKDFKNYCASCWILFVVVIADARNHEPEKLLNMFRALLCPSSGARQTAVAASGFLMNVEVHVFSAVVGLLD